MKRNDIKNLAIFSIIIVIVAVIATALSLMNNNSKILDRMLSTANKDSINQIEIIKGDSTIKLIKGSDWKVNEFSADSTVVSAFLDQVTKAKIKEISSTNKDNYKTFGVADDSTKIKLYENDKPVLNFIIGKASSTGGTYIRLEGDANVYSIDQNVIAFAEKDVTDLRDKTIASMDTNNLQSIQTNNVVLKKDNDVWYSVELGSINKDKKLDQSKTLDFIKNLAVLNATSLDTNTNKNSLTTPILTVTLEDNNKNSQSYNIYKIGDNYIVTKSSDSLVYNIAAYQFELLNKKVSDILEVETK